MDVIMSILNKTMTCLENICNDIQRRCCQTRKQIHQSEHKKEEVNHSLKENDIKRIIYS